MSPAIRSLLKKLALATVSLVVFLLLLEGGLRLSGRVPTNALRSPDLETLGKIPGVLEPGQDFIDRILPDLPYRIRTNSHGFRGKDFDIPKKAGTFRVLVVGDSYTLGPYVEDSETLPGQLGRLLRRRLPGAEVVNGGVNGFTITDEVRLLEKSMDHVDPDLVIVAFSQNDVLDLVRPALMIDLMSEHAGTKSLPVIGPLIRLLQHTALFNGMQRLAAGVRGRPAPPPPPKKIAAPGEGPQDPSGARNLWDRYQEGLGECARLLESRGVPWLLVVWPSARQMEGLDSMKPQGRLRGIAEEVGVPLFDLTPAIGEVEARGEKAFLVPLDGHPNAAGYAAAARALAEHLTGEGYLAEPARPPGETPPEIRLIPLSGLLFVVVLNQGGR